MIIQPLRSKIDQLEQELVGFNFSSDSLKQMQAGTFPYHPKRHPYQVVEIMAAWVELQKAEIEALKVAMK